MAWLIDIPGAEPVNEGERVLVQALLQGLPDGYWIAANVELSEPNGGQLFEYDAVVIAPHAVYAIEIKDWNGVIVGDHREWLVNGRSRKAPQLAIERKARILKSKLVSRAPALARVWVEPAVVLVGTTERLELTPEGRRGIHTRDSLIKFICDPGAVQQRTDSIAELGAPIRSAITGQLRRRSRPLIFGSYEVIERLDQSRDEALYRAHHLYLPDAPQVLLRVVSPSAYSLSEQQRRQRFEELSREAELLLKMGSHPNIVAAKDLFQEGGSFVLVLESAEGRSLRQRLKDGTPLTVAERLSVISGVCRALTHAHSFKIVHRLVEPANVLLAEDGSVRLTGFGRAKLLEGTEGTVWSDDILGDLDQRYLAPELINPALGAPSPGTDLFSLGCIAFELFAGTPPFAQPGNSRGEIPAFPEGMPEDLAHLVRQMLLANPALRLQDSAALSGELDRMRGGAPSEPKGTVKDEYEPGDVIDGKFTVLGPLGGGGFSHVYRVLNALHQQEYALKVFNGESYEKVHREASILLNIESPHIVRAIWADQTAEGQWYLVTEYIRGETLAAYASGEKRLSIEESCEIASEILQALESIHPQSQRIAELDEKARQGDLTIEEYDELRELKTSGIVHRDIKPQNLMLAADGIRVIDFNIASRVGEKVNTLSGTPPYMAPDILAGVDAWDVSPDLFAVGVVLYELICCEHPYPDRQPQMAVDPRDPRDFRPEAADDLAEFLIRACASHRSERFTTAREMRIALEDIDPLTRPRPTQVATGLSVRLRQLLAEAPPNVNPMVRELLALSSQARRSNRSTRGLDDLAEATYVETVLDSELAESVLSGKLTLVLVTGNAGDGKTAFIQHVEQIATERGAVVLDSSPNGRHLTLGEREIVTLYDGSQDEQDRTSDELLLDFLHPFESGSISNSVRLAAVNEGRLRDFLYVHKEQYGDFATNLLASLDESGHNLLPPQIAVINLNLRSVTAGGSNSIFTRQLRHIVQAPFWEPCEACDFRQRCPIKHNVDTFKDSVSGEAAAERLRTLINVIRLRRRRHLTIRDIRSLISFILFRDRTCEEIAEVIERGDPQEVLDLMYFQGVGGVGSTVGTELERGARLLGEFDVGLVSNPNDDRLLALGEGQRRMAFPDRSAAYADDLIQVLRQRAGSGYESRPVEARRVHEASRRQAYFERADDGWQTMLPYSRLGEFEMALAPSAEGERYQRKRELISALSMSEGMADETAAEQWLWLCTTDNADSLERSFRRFPSADFDLRVLEVAAQFVEAEPDRLQLFHRPSSASLDLDIDLLEVLKRLRQGYVPANDESSAFLVNLKLFKHRLLSLESEELLLQTQSGRLICIAAGANRSQVVLSEEVLA